MVYVRGKYRSTLGITCTAELWLGTAEPGNKSTLKVIRQQPGIRMLDYDLKLQFIVKTKWKVRRLRLTCSSAIFRKGVRGKPRGKSCGGMLMLGDALLWQLWKGGLCVHTVGYDSALRFRKVKSEMPLITSVCYSGGAANTSTDYFHTSAQCGHKSVPQRAWRLWAAACRSPSAYVW